MSGIVIIIQFSLCILPCIIIFQIDIFVFNSTTNGITAGTAYVVFSVPTSTSITITDEWQGTEIETLVNGTGLLIGSRANSGVGATLTNNGTQSALVIDGVSVALNNRVLVNNQTNAAWNGVYVVSVVGDGSTNWVLTRSSDEDFYNPFSTSGMSSGDYFFVQSGTTLGYHSFVCTNTTTITFGSTAITFTEFSSVPAYVGGTNININGQTISVTGTIDETNGGTGVNTVTTGDLLYGSGTNTWSKLAAGSQYKSLVMGASTPEWNSVSLSSAGAVSGVLPEGYGGKYCSKYPERC